MIVAGESGRLVHGPRVYKGLSLPDGQLVLLRYTLPKTRLARRPLRMHQDDDEVVGSNGDDPRQPALG